MSRMMTLKDLQARQGNSESYGFNVERNSSSKSQCRQCLEIFFPNFKLRSLTMLFVFVCTAMYVTTRILDKTVMGNTNDDYEKWVCTLRAFGAKFTYDIT